MFGRVHVPDVRDSFYDGRVLYKKNSPKKSSHRPAELYEGEDLPYSPGVAWWHWLVSQRSTKKPLPFHISPYDLYKAGEVEGGATIRGGAKFLKEIKLIRSYYWTRDAEVLANFILHYGTAVVGSDWYEGMMTPAYETGRIYATGEKVGEHAYAISGVNTRSGWIRIKNSLGKKWGRDGYGYLPLKDMQKLLDDNGEACLPVDFRKRFVP